MKKFKKFNTIDILEKMEVFEQLSFDQTLYAFKTVVFGLCTASLVLIIEFVNNYLISKLTTNHIILQQLLSCIGHGIIFAENS